MLFDTDRISAYFSWVSNATWEKYFVVYVYNQPKNQQPVLIWVNFVELYTGNSFTAFTIRNNHTLSATSQCFINTVKGFTQGTLTSFNNKIVFSMSSRFGGSRARASRAFGSPMLNTLVCRTSFSNGQRYRKSHSQL